MPLQGIERIQFEIKISGRRVDDDVLFPFAARKQEEGIKQKSGEQKPTGWQRSCSHIFNVFKMEELGKRVVADSGMMQFVQPVIWHHLLRCAARMLAHG